jgi:hypothetical protein
LGEKKIACEVLLGRNDGNIQLDKPGTRLEDDIKIDLEEISWEVEDWIYVADSRKKWWVFVKTLAKLRVS